MIEYPMRQRGPERFACGQDFRFADVGLPDSFNSPFSQPLLSLQISKCSVVPVGLGDELPTDVTSTYVLRCAIERQL